MPDLSFEEFERHLQERAAIVRAEVAEEIARAIEAQDGGDQGLPSGRDGRAFYASVARQHAERNTDA